MAEALVRVPALHANTVTRGFALGIGAAALVAAIGALLIPRLKRTALRYQTTEQT
jgi:hypothetical protein